MIKKFTKKLIKYVFYTSLVLLFFIFAFNNNEEFNELLLATIISTIIMGFSAALIIYLFLLPLLYIGLQKVVPNLEDKIDNFWMHLIIISICLLIGFNLTIYST